MRRFFLHLTERGRTVRDEEGREYAGLAEAREVAIAAIRDVAAADIIEGILDTGLCVTVCDEAGVPLMEVAFADAVTARDR